MGCIPDIPHMATGIYSDIDDWQVNLGLPYFKTSPNSQKCENASNDWSGFSWQEWRCSQEMMLCWWLFVVSFNQVDLSGVERTWGFWAWRFNCLLGSWTFQHFQRDDRFGFCFPRTGFLILRKHENIWKHMRTCIKNTQLLLGLGLGRKN